MTNLNRRELVTGALCLTLGSRSALAHNDAGLVSPPEPVPAVALELDDGARATLQSALTGRISAVQLMFTSCQATCPIQGALFGQTLKKLGDRVKHAQLVSLSIDPDRDTPAQLREWMKRFGGSTRWRAGRPDKKQLDTLVAFLKSKKAGSDPHTAQVYYFNSRAELVLRSVDFPPAAEVANALEQIAKKR